MYFNKNILEKAPISKDYAAYINLLNKQLQDLLLASSEDALWTTKDVASYLRRSEKWVNQRSKDDDFQKLSMFLEN
jgi:hypothetical protein